MQQRKGKVLSIGFTCPTTVEVGDVAVITSSDNTIQANSAEASTKIVGTVAAHVEDATSCVVETRFRERRDDRIAASVFANGPFVWGATGLATPYAEGTIASATGTEEGPFTITATAATPAVGSASETFSFEAAVGGTVTSGDGPFTFVLNTSDAFKIKIGAAVSQTFTLTGAGVDAANVAAQFSAGVGFTATVVGAGVKFLATTVTDDLEIEAVANDCYTVMGLTAAAHLDTPGNNKLSVTVSDGDPQVLTLTGSARTAVQVATEINLTAADFTATADDGSVVLTVDDATDYLDINVIANDCYTELGFTAGTFASVEGNNTLLIAITGGSESGGADQTFTITSGERTVTQVKTEINLTAEDFTASVASGVLVLTCDQIGDDLVIKTAANADACTDLGITRGTVTGDVPTYSPAAIVGLQIEGPAVNWIQCGIPGPYLLTASDNVIKITIEGGTAQTFTLDTGAAVTATTLAATINSTATNCVASAVDDYLRITADAAGKDITLSTVSNDAYDILGWTTDTYEAAMAIVTLEK